MADNFLERQYDDYLRLKTKREEAKRLKWRKQLEAYRKQMEVEKKNNQSEDIQSHQED